MIFLEFRGESLAEADRLCGNDVHERAALIAGEYRFVYCGRKLLGREDKTAPRPPEGLVSGGGDDIGIGHGRGMQPRRHKTCDMSHIHHEVCAYLLCERPDALKINYPRVGGGARHDELRLYFPCLALKAVVINEAVGVNAVGHEFIELAAGIDGRAVGQMPAVGKAHAHHRVARLKYSRVRRHICLSARVGLHIRRLCAESSLARSIAIFSTTSTHSQPP